MKINYVDRMNKIIASKRQKGLVGIKFCILPEGKAGQDNAQAIARAFCKAEELRARGILKATTSSSL